MRHEATGNSRKVKVIGVVLSALVLAFSSPAGAQQAKGIPQIGFLSGGFPSARQNADTFRRGLSDLGYVEGKNIGILYRYGEGNVDRLPQLAAELVRLNVGVILAGGTVAALAAKQATKTIPIVFVNVADPLSVGLVVSLARPGGNMTGMSTINSDLTSKRLGLLKESVPAVSRVALLYNPSDASNVVFLKQLQSSAHGLGLTIRLNEVRVPADFDPAFSSMARDGVNGLTVAAGTLTSTHRRRIVDLALKSRLPAMYGERSFVEVGGLMSYAANFTEQYRRAAVYVAKVLKGTKPADIPVEQPTKFEFVVNLKTAKQIGLTIPQSVLYQADRVIK
jgi:putative tryptophan/tyrosine transport system substrate-binding protein